VNINSGLALARWIAATHPGLLLTLARQIPKKPVVPITVRGLGDDAPTFDLPDPAMLDVTSSLNVADPTLVDVTSSLDVGQPLFDFSAAGSTDSGTSGGFLSSIGNAISSVGSFLTTGGGLNALANTASAYFNSQSTAKNAQVQTAVLQAQSARALTGAAPANVSYVTNPLTGQVTPVLNTAGGTVPLSSSLLSSITPSGLSAFLSQYGLWLALGAAGLVVLTSLRNPS